MIPSPRTIRRQRAILDYIHNFQNQHGYAPTVRQIQRHLRMRSPSGVTYHLNALERAGLLHRSGRHARNLALTPERPAAHVPLLGDLAAGQPLPDPTARRDTPVPTVTVPIAAGLGKLAPSLYALRVRGHAFHAALLADGDIVLIEPQNHARAGELVAVQSEAAGVQVLRWTASDLSASPPLASFHIHGRVVSVLRSLYYPAA